MEARSVLEGLKYVGEVESSRQTYFVYKGGDHYVLLSASMSRERSGNIGIVKAEAADYVWKLFAGQTGVTKNDVVKRAKRPTLIHNDWDALNTLYVLCACDRATIDHRFKRQALHFSIRT